MTTAVRAGDLDPPAVRIETLAHCPIDRRVEARPTAARVEFVDRLVERGIASSADEGAGIIQLLILAAEGSLGPLVNDDALFIGRQGVVSHRYPPGRSH
jgi:hypothetical protein